jgi:hypothetical protein
VTGETEARFAGTNPTVCVESAQVVAYITDSLAIRRFNAPSIRVSLRCAAGDLGGNRGRTSGLTGLATIDRI